MQRVVVDRELDLTDIQALAEAIQQLRLANESKQEQKQLKPVLTVKEAANYLQVSQDTIYELIYRGRIPARKVGRQWRISRTKLMQVLETEDIYEPPYALPR